jgi:hypothetical protein
MKNAIDETQILFFMNHKDTAVLEPGASDYGLEASLYQIVEEVQQLILFMSELLDKTQPK